MAKKTTVRPCRQGTNEPKNSEAVRASPSAGAPVPIVGVGASAGGLEAFKGLLQHLPTDTGMAFVLVQHLDPHRESMLVELLGRQAGMPVVEAGDGMRVEPNHLYVTLPLLVDRSGAPKALSSTECPVEPGQEEGADGR